jgi:sugar phosphate isomerase/epimerase
MMNRRSFLEACLGGAAVTAGSVLSRRLAWGAAEGKHKLNRIGVQLYSVRDEMARDFDVTLAKVAAIGYKEVEFAGYFGRTPKQVRTALDGMGLSSPATHVPFDVLGEKWPEQIESAKVIGQNYIVCPWIPEEIRKAPDGWKRAVDTFNRAGEMSRKAGVQFAYHNHWFEFIPVDGKLPYDYLLENCDAKFVKMEMDLCWITVGGGDPLKYFAKYPGRFPLVHVKDVKTMPKVTASGGQDFGNSVDLASVGDGVIDWKRIFVHSEEAGIKHYIVEHDRPKDPFASIGSSYEYLRGLRW